MNPPIHTIRAIAIASFTALATSVAMAGPEDIAEPRLITAETVLVEEGDAVATIVYPGPPSDDKEAAYWNHADPEGTTEAYAGLAREVAAAIESVTDVAVPVRRADQLSDDDRDGNLILLGRMNNNPVAFDLYVKRRIAADDWFPGPAGYVVRTVTDPWGKGTNAILLGGSDVAGVERAVSTFLELPELDGRSPTLIVPRQWNVHFEGMDEHIDEFAEGIASHYDEVYFERSYYHGMEGHIWRAAQHYFVTGRREYLEAFEGMMQRTMPSDWDAVNIRANPTGHAVPGGMEKYPAARLGPAYAAVEDSPHFSDEFRLSMANWLYKTFWQWCGHRSIQDWNPGEFRVLPAWNRARVAVSRGDYFRKYYPDLDLSRYDALLENVHIGLAALVQDHNLGAPERGGYSLYMPTIAMRMFLLLDEMGFFESGNAAKWLDFKIQMTDNRGDRSQYTRFDGLGRAGTQDGWLFPLLYHKDPTYQWLIGRDEARLADLLQPKLTSDELNYRLWTFIPKMPAETPDHVTGMQSTGVSPAAYESARQTGWDLSLFRPGGYDGRVPQERTYRILTMRTDFDFETDRQEQYLRMHGTSVYNQLGGIGPNEIDSLQHGPYAANEDFGIWLNGSEIEYEMFSDLKVASEHTRTGFARSIAFSDAADWSRDIVWRKHGYWLILNRIAVGREGDFRFTNEWSSDELHIRQAAGLDDFSSQLDAGDEYVFATLISREDHEIRRINDDLYEVQEDDVTTLIGSRAMTAEGQPQTLHGDFTVDSDFFLLSPHEVSFAGLRRFGAEAALIASDRPVDLELDLEGNRLEVEAAAPVRLRIAGVRVRQAEQRTVYRDGATVMTLDAGRHQLEIEPDAQMGRSVAALIEDVAGQSSAPVAFEPETLEYPRALGERWRYELGDTVAKVIEAADLTGDGRDEVLLGLENGAVIRLSPEGEEQWTFHATGDMDAVQERLGRNPVWARGGHAINAITTADFGEGVRVLVTSTDSYVYCLDASTGDVVWKFSGRDIDVPPFTASGATRGQVDRAQEAMAELGGPMYGVTVADINGDGAEEVLVGGGGWEGRDWYYGRLWVLDGEGGLHWHRFVQQATVPSQVTVFGEGDGPRRIAVAGHHYPYARRIYVYDYEGERVATLQSGRYHQLGTGHTGGPGASERLMLFNFQLRDHKIRAHAVDRDLEDPLWTYQVSDPFAFLLADLSGNGTDEILAAESGGILYCLSEADGDEPSVNWQLNLRESLPHAPQPPWRRAVPPRAMVAVTLTGHGAQVALGSAGTVFAIDSDGAPLARLELPRNDGVNLAATRLDDGSRESLLVGAADMGGDATEGGFVAAYDLE